MSLLPFSNIRVDNFEYMKNDLAQYVFFLTHCHEDHLKGLTPSWNFGTIYASRVSKVLICDRYPQLKDHVIALEMNEEHWIYCDSSKKEGVLVTFIDACHCPGAVMILFRGKFGNILHTGDFRFSATMLDNETLFPPERRNKDFKQIAIDIDYLFLDNTFADSSVSFPDREEAFNNVKQIVESHRKFRVFLFAYLLGKEEVFINLAKEFQTLIVVDEERYKKIKLMDLEPDLFTTDENAGWIHVKPIKSLKWLNLEDVNKEAPTVFIVLTGWSNKYNSTLPFYFKAPYSSHSNPRELERFVKAVCPKNVVFTVPDRENSQTRLDFQHYLINEYVVKPHRSEQEISQLTINDRLGAIISR
jgi:DNA cross-link repair 1B protein